MRKSLISCLLVSAAAFAFPACGDDDSIDDDGDQGGASGANMGGGQAMGGTSGGGGRGGTGGGGRGGAGGGAVGDAGAGVGGGATGGTDAGGAGAGGMGAAGGTDAGAGGSIGGAAGGPDGEAGEIGIGGEAGDGGEAGAGGGANLSDDQVIQVVETVNVGEIAMAEVALDRAVDPEVRAYAQEMIMDHTAANQMAMALAMAEDLTPRPSALSRDLTREATAIVNWLEITPPGLFDRSYMQSQVAAHAEVLARIDDVLLPSAADPELDAFLTTVRTTVAEHLAHAEMILEMLE